jgi:trypsin-like peptidase
VRWVVLLLGVLAALTSGAADLPDRCTESGRLLTELGSRERFAMTFPADHEIEPVPPTADPRARYVRVRVKAQDFEGCPWNLTVRDENYRFIQSMTAEDFKNSSTRWTVRIAGGRTFFDLRRCPGLLKPVIKFDEYIWMPTQTEHPYYSIQGGEPTYRALFSEATSLRRLGDSVGMFMSSWDRVSWLCSGAMVAEDLFLTNWHCGGPEWISDASQPERRRAFREDFYWQDPIVKDALIDLSFDGDKLSREYAVTGIAALSMELDFALLKVQPLDAIGKPRPFFLRSTPLASGDPFQIVHHAEGKEKQITTNCRVETKEFAGWRPGSGKSDFTYRCDTEAGSSGAPILDENGDIAGLHHLGFKKEGTSCDHLNKGVRVDKILDFLWRYHRDIYARLTVH